VILDRFFGQFVSVLVTKFVSMIRVVPRAYLDSRSCRSHIPCHILALLKLLVILAESDANPRPDESLSSCRLVYLLRRGVSDGVRCRTLAHQDFYERGRPGQQLHKFTDAGLSRIPVGLHARWPKPL